MEKTNVTHRPRSRGLGDVIAAALLALGAAIEHKRTSEAHGYRAWLAAVPIVFVNFVAFYGQLSYFQAHRHPIAGVTIPPVVSTIMALALESIAIYLAWQAHVARKSHDSALRLRLAAYLVALGIGALNYSHFCGPRWQPNAYAVAFALASVISPALWGIHSNRESRDDLKAQGLIEDHAVRLGATRWFWHAYRCVKVMWAATWTGENRPAEAIRLIDKPREDRPELTGRARGKNTQTAGLDQAARGTGQAVAPGAAGQTPPSAPSSTDREPRRAVPVRAARAAGLAVAQDVRARIVLELMGVQVLPSISKLVKADARLKGSRRTAAGILKEVRAKRNGSGDGHGDDDRA